MSSPTDHIVILTLMAWSHITAGVNLSTKIVRRRPVFVTCVVGDGMYDKAAALLNTLFVPGEEDELKKLVRVVGVDNGPNPMEFSVFQKNFEGTFANLLASKPTPERPGSQQLTQVAPPPRLAVIDGSAYDSMKSIQRLSNGKVKCLVQQCCVVASTLIFGPKEEGGPGLGDMAPELDAIIASTPDPKEQCKKMDGLLFRETGKVWKLPGLPPIHDWETSTQKSVMPFPMAPFVKDRYAFYYESDGFVYSSNRIFEKESIEESNRVFKAKNAIEVGPFAYPIIKPPRDTSPRALEVEAFMDKALKAGGPKSVFYFSLGSIHWTAEPEKVWALLDILLEKGVYFLYAYPSPFLGSLPEEVKAKLDGAKDRVYHADWLPQPQILAHEALGWFITHGGHNSYSEALCEGVPMICIPIVGDQPYNGLYITDVHDIGYELYNMRNGIGAKPIHRMNDWTPPCTVDAVKEEFKKVLDSALGEEGKKKRENVVKLKEQIAATWAPDGSSWKELDKFFED